MRASATPLLLGTPDPSLDTHLRTHGPLPLDLDVAALAEALSAAEVRGRGGAGFPAARKLLAVNGRSPLVIANGSEGEPLSGKDALLMGHAPHLVLDGLAVLGAALGARDLVVRAPAASLEPLARAAAERGETGRFEFSASGGGFVDGEASAVRRAVLGGPALPEHHDERLTSGGRRTRPTLVQNVETLARIALVVRWAARGGPCPTTRLYTVSGSVASPGVVEAEAGTSAAELAAAAGWHGDARAGWLIGGYHGLWLDDASAREPGSAEIGAGIVHVVGPEVCPLAIVVEAARFLASVSAGQCGPCRFGLPALAGAVADALGPGAGGLAAGGTAAQRRVQELLAQVDGRGACAHPDGTARFLRSALSAQRPELEAHAAGRCAAGDPPRGPHAVPYGSEPPGGATHGGSAWGQPWEVPA